MRAAASTPARTGHPVRGFVPLVDLAENDAGFTLTFELPGVARSDLSVHFDRGLLTVSGTKEIARGTGRARHSERATGPFSRTSYLGEEADPDAIEARLEGGLLRVRVGKRPAATPRRIRVA